MTSATRISYSARIAALAAEHPDDVALVMAPQNAPDFSLTWPATIGVRMLIPGLILLVIEVALVLHAKRKPAHDEHQGLV